MAAPAQANAQLEGRRERKKRELRLHIYETARSLFFEHGFEATTVEQIAEAADVAQATFFNHFQSKQAVLAEMTREVFDRLEELIEEQAAREVSTEARIAGFTRRMAEEIAGAQGLARDVLLELMRSSGRAGQPIPYLALAKGPFARMMQEGQGRGDVRGDIEAAFLAEMIIGALNIVITNWMADTDYALEERLEQTANFLAEALAPRPRS